MSHIQICNSYDLSRYLPFKSAAFEPIGWIRKDRLTHLQKYRDIFDIFEDRVLLCPDTYHARTQAMETVCQELHQAGHFDHWRDERYKVCQNFTDPGLFDLDRSAISFFGIKAFGVHLNGYVQTETGIDMWVARRAADRYIAPNQLDNMVAGGQPADLSFKANILKECAEEAGIPARLAQQARPAGFINYAMETDDGLKPDVMYIYDLCVPDDFIPENTDGEVAGFERLPLSQVAEIVRTSEAFKFNCNLVIIDFLLRHGFLDPDSTPDYEALGRGLRPANLF